MSNDNVSLNTSGTNGVNYVGNVETGTTPPTTTSKPTSTKDTTSKATNVDSNGESGVSAGAPVLPNPSTMSDADLMVLISSALSEANKQRRISQQTKEPLFIAQYVVTQIPVTSSESDTTVDAEVDAEVKVGDTEVKVSAKTSSDDDKKATGSTVLGETQVQTILANTLSDAVNERLEKRLTKRLPHLTMDAIANFLNSIITSGVQLIILPALNNLGQAGKIFRVDKTAVDTSTAVQFGKYVLELVDTDQVKSFATKALKDDPRLATQLATILETVMIQAASIQVGNASGLPGLGNQINVQAQVFRNQQTVLTDKGSDIVAAALKSAVLPEGVTPEQLSAKVNQAVKDALAEGPFNNRQDLLNALSKQIKQQIPDDETTADALVAALDQESFAAVTAGSLIYVPNFDSSTINKDTFADSIKQAILIAFAKSQEEVNNASKARARADEISDAVLAQGYKSEAALREAVRVEVKAALADQEITEEQVNQIVAGLNIPADPTDPLYDGNSTAIVPPWIYASLVRNDYQKTAQIVPESDLGQDFDLVAGIDIGHATSAIALMNEAHAAANTETRSYLNLTPQEAQIVAQQELTDPAAVLRNLGTLMNGTLPPDYQQARFV